MVTLTPKNWKNHRARIAGEQFKLDALVQYTRGFVTFNDNKFGTVLRITDAGAIYVARVELQEIRHEPENLLMGGWIEYDPNKITRLAEEHLRFSPRLVEPQRDGQYALIWDGPYQSRNFQNMGNYHLRPVEVGKKGILRAKVSGCL